MRERKRSRILWDEERNPHTTNLKLDDYVTGTFGEYFDFYWFLNFVTFWNVFKKPTKICNLKKRKFWILTKNPTFLPNINFVTHKLEKRRIFWCSFS